MTVWCALSSLIGPHAHTNLEARFLECVRRDDQHLDDLIFNNKNCIFNLVIVIEINFYQKQYFFKLNTKSELCHLPYVYVYVPSSYIIMCQSYYLQKLMIYNPEETF